MHDIPCFLQLTCFDLRHSLSTTPHHLSFTSKRRPRHYFPIRRASPRCNYVAPSSSTNNNNNPNNASDLSRQAIPTLQQLRSLLSEGTKVSQQRAITYAFRLLDEDTITLLLPLLTPTISNSTFNITTSDDSQDSKVPIAACNEFIKSSAAVCFGRALGKLNSHSPNHPSISPATNALVNVLASDEDYGVRSAAAAGLGYLYQNQAAFNALARSFYEDDHWQVKFSALAGLGELGKAEAVPILKGGLKNENDLVVQSAVGALGNVGGKGVVGDLIELGGSKDVMTRQRVADALGNIGEVDEGGKVVRVLSKLREDDTLIVREAAELALKRLGVGNRDKGDEEIDESKVSLEQQLKRGKVGRTSPSLDSSTSSSSSPSSSSYSQAFSRTTQLSAETPSPPPSQGTNSDVNKDQSSSGSSSSSTNDSEIDTLAAQLKEGDVTQKALAAIKLRKYDHSKALQAAEAASLINDPSERVRAAAVTLHALGGDVDTLVQVIQADKDQSVRGAACDALLDTEAGPEAIRACLEAFKHDEHWLVRSSAAIALGSLGRKLREEVVEALIKSLKKDGIEGLAPPQDQILRRHAVTALGFLGEESAVEAFKRLVRFMPGEPIKYRIAAALRGIRTKESKELLENMLQDRNSSVVEMAKGSLEVLNKEGV